MQDNESNSSTIKRNILRFLESRRVSEYRFYKESGMSRGILKNKGGLTESNIAKFLAYAPEVNADWLLTGRGNMMRAKAEKIEGPPALPSAAPLVSPEVAAGFSSGNLHISENDILDRYVIPDFTNVSFMIRVRGTSMYPRYKSGDVVACRILNDPSYIQWNKTYVIATRDQGLLVKRLKPGQKNGHYLCVSDNSEYDPFEIPVDECTSLALVVGVVRIE